MPKRNLFRSVFALIFCAVFLFAGCTPGSKGTTPQGQPLLETGKSNANSTTGKFVQQDVTPPDLTNIPIDQIRQLPDGRVLAIGVAEDDIPRAYATADGAVWEAVYPFENSELLSRYPQHNRVFTLDNDGAWWVAVSTREGDDNHLFKISGGQAHEVAVSDFQSGKSGFVPSVTVDETNTLLLSTGGETGVRWTLVDCAAAAEKSAFSPAPIQPSFACIAGGKVYAGSFGEAAVVEFGSDGKQENRYSVPLNADELHMNTSSIRDGILYYASQNGLYKAALDGSFVETLTDNTGYAYANANAGREQILAASDNSYWVLLRVGARDYKLYRYLFDATAPVVAANQLDIWAMEDNPMLRLAVSVFLRENPDYDVTVEYGHSGEGGAQTDEDIIRTLNTRLLSKDGPDVLILDSLPVNNMIKQGMLTDISGIVNTGEYYPNILSTYARDGKTYAYPALFWAPVMAQKSGTAGPGLENISSLEDLRGIKSENQIAYGGYYHLFDTFYIAASPAIFPQDASVDENSLRSFLSVTKEISDAQGLAAKEFNKEFGWMFEEHDAPNSSKIDWGGVSPSLGYYGNEYKANVSHGVGTMYGYDVWFTSGIDSTLAPMPGNAFLPVCIGGVPVGAANEEGGRQFIKTMLECQTVENLVGMRLPGFSVRLGADREDFLSIGDEAELAKMGIDLDAINLEGVMQQLTTPASTNASLRRKVYAQAKQLYTGKISLDEAVAAVMKDTELYFAEQQ